jgi:hypothetical protein
MATVQYSLVFGLLMLEVAAFAIILLPWPHAWRESAMRWIARYAEPWSNRVNSTVRVLLVFIFLLFIDAVNRAIRVPNSLAHKADHQVGVLDLQLKVYRAQRNMYLTGFTLFLAWALRRVVALLWQAMVRENVYASQVEAVCRNTKFRGFPDFHFC